MYFSAIPSVMQGRSYKLQPFSPSRVQGHALAVESQEVVQWGAESGDLGKEFKRAMRSVPVVVVKEGVEAWRRAARCAEWA
jgi:hypothetical protein